MPAPLSFPGEPATHQIHVCHPVSVGQAEVLGHSEPGEEGLEGMCPWEAGQTDGGSLQGLSSIASLLGIWSGFPGWLSLRALTCQSLRHVTGCCDTQ